MSTLSVGATSLSGSRKGKSLTNFIYYSDGSYMKNINIYQHIAVQSETKTQMRNRVESEYIDNIETIIFNDVKYKLGEICATVDLYLVPDKFDIINHIACINTVIRHTIEYNSKYIVQITNKNYNYIDIDKYHIVYTDSNSNHISRSNRIDIYKSDFDNYKNLFYDTMINSLYNELIFGPKLHAYNFKSKDDIIIIE